MSFRTPIRNMRSVQLNETLHGRSVFRSQDVPHHNVYKGYLSPGTGDANDLFCPAGTDVFAIEDGVQTQLRADGLRGHVLYLESDGWTAVYAHIDPIHEGANRRFAKGDVIAHVGNHINDTHVHFELWVNGRSINASSPGKLRMKFLQLMGEEDGAADNSEPRLIVAKSDNGPTSFNGFAYNELPSRFDHRARRFSVDTQALAEWLDKDAAGQPHFLPVREALQRMGVEATYNDDHMHSSSEQREYVFVK